MSRTLSKATIAGVMLAAFYATGAYATAEKISYKSCLDFLKFAKALKGDGIPAAMAHQTLTKPFERVGGATIYVAQLQEGPKIGDAKAALVFAFEGDENFTMKIHCSPSGSTKDMGEGKKIMARKIEAVQKKLNAEIKSLEAEIEKKKAEKVKEEAARKQAQASPSFLSQMEKTLASRSQPPSRSQPLAISEIDTVRQQIRECWSLPAGAREAEDLSIEIKLVINPDRTVRQARILDQDRLQSDPYFRAAAESALRAVLNPRCNPLKLPTEKYQQWQNMVLIFDPRQMF